MPTWLPGFVAFSAMGPDDPDPDPHPGETQLIHRRMVPHRRSELLRGRAAARRALARFSLADVAIARGPHREPIWPSGIVGSITHTAGHVMAAVARRSDTAGIGIDLEHDNRWFDGLADKTTTPAERLRLAGLEPSAVPRATIEIFSAKEALFKALYPGVGRYFGFTAAETGPVTHRGTLEIRLLETLGPEHPAGATTGVTIGWSGGLVLSTVVLPASPSS